MKRVLLGLFTVAALGVSTSVQAVTYDTSAPTGGYALNPAQQFVQQQNMLNYQAPQPVYYYQPQPVSQGNQNEQPINYVVPQQQQNAYIMQQINSDPYYAQMEAKARELNLSKTDRAIENVARSERADRQTEARDKMYTAREAFHTVDTGVNTVSRIQSLSKGRATWSNFFPSYR